jgi:hypothetical protein
MSTCRVSSTRRMSLSSTGTEAARAAQDIARQASPEQCHTFLAQVAACYNYSLKASFEHAPATFLDAKSSACLMLLLHSSFFSFCTRPKPQTPSP